MKSSALCADQATNIRMLIVLPQHVKYPTVDLDVEPPPTGVIFDMLHIGVAHDVIIIDQSIRQCFRHSCFPTEWGAAAPTCAHFELVDADSAADHHVALICEVEGVVRLHLDPQAWPPHGHMLQEVGIYPNKGYYVYG